MTGIVRLVLAWYSPKPGYSTDCRSYSSSRSPPVSTVAVTPKRSVPTSTVASGGATRLWYQSGLVGAPALLAKTTSRSPSARYIIGFVRCAPVLAPVEVSSSSGAPTNWPLTSPPFAWNSLMMRLLKSSAAGSSVMISPLARRRLRPGSTIVLRGAQRAGETLHIAAELAAIRVMGRVDLGEDEPGEGQVRQHDPQRGDRVREADTRAVMREVAERQVAGVHHVHVEMHHDRPAGCSDMRHRGGGHRGGIGDEFRRLGEPYARPGQETPPGIVGLPRVGANDREPARVEQRRLAVQPGQLRGAAAEQVHDAHRVEDARAAGLRRAEVRIAVQVQQAGIGMAPPESGDDAERDGAVAADHQRDAALLRHAGHRIGRLAGDADDGGQAPAGR